MSLLRPRSFVLFVFPLIASAVLLARGVAGVADEEEVWALYRSEEHPSAQRFQHLLVLSLRGEFDDWTPDEIDAELQRIDRVHRRHFRYLFPHHFVGAK